MSLILGWLASHWLLVAAVAVGIAALANPVLVWKLKAWILLAVGSALLIPVATSFRQKGHS